MIATLAVAAPGLCRYVPMPSVVQDILAMFSGPLATVQRGLQPANQHTFRVDDETHVLASMRGPVMASGPCRRA